VTNFDAPPMTNAVPAPPATASSGVRTLCWGILLMIVGGVMVIAGAASSDGGDSSSETIQTAVQLGWLLGALALPLVLIGCIAIGVRMGLRDHSRD
jgi:hypothetical protein